jgi:hypothetical protein
MSEEREPTPPEEQPPEQQPEQQPEQPPQQPPQEEQEQRQQVDWRDRRIGEQQQRLRERAARISELEAQLAQFQNAQSNPAQQSYQPQVPAQYQQPQPTGDIQRQINEAAAQMASQQEFTRRCNEVAELGRRQYNNFDQRVQRLISLVDGSDSVQVERYNGFLSATMETGDAARLIYDLGGDLNEASRIMAMNPVRMAVELTKMAGRATTTEASQAPRPLNPVATAGQSNRMSAQPDNPDTADALSIDDWMRQREEQIASRRQRTLG